ncbi:MAG: alpha/beta hydrolase [Acidobacteria bacterium]|nr:alpha/beta hydrolase [Acidobacteriota bacterium]
MRGSALLGLLLLPSAFAEYATVNGVRMYYEVHGQGRPVVLLHGGMNSIQTSFARQIPAFSGTHRVIAIDQMAHGRTADVSGRALSYEQMAEDTAALLVHLGIRDADLVGWSDGGQIALRLAFTHPELIRRVVASGVGFGASPSMRRSMADDKWWDRFSNNGFPEGRAEYNRVSPDGPEHWRVYAEKARSMWGAPTWGFAEADLVKIKLPVLIISGDGEKVEEMARIFRAIPKAKLFVLPGTGHSTFQDRPDWLNRVVLDYLDRD